MKKTYTAFAFIFLFSAIPTAEAAEQAATICSIYYETLSACNEARAQESSGSTLTACTYTSGSGYQWCVSGTGSSLNTDLTLDTDLTDTDTTTTCAYTTATACVSAYTTVAGCTKDTSTGCYYPTSCKSGYYKNSTLQLVITGTSEAGVRCMECPENGTCNGTSVTCNSGYTLTSTNPESSTLTLVGTMWCVSSSAVDTVVSCPTGTSLTTDGCCCVND